ncbi:hypothetical protein EON65_06935 [archaeon]|nr:MAG: hypothetical protein EON65_06935 [archaeon]
MSGFDKSWKSVEGLQDLQSNKLKLLCWTGEDGMSIFYAVQSDNRNKSPRYFPLPFEIINAQFELTEDVMERAWIDSGYGREHGLSELSLFGKALQIQIRAHKLVIERSILSFLESNRAKQKKLPEVRLTESIDATHGFHNGMILFVDMIAQLYQLVIIYNNRQQGHIQSTHFDEDEHVDRVDSLFVLPLSYLVNMSALQLYQHILHQILPPLSIYGDNIHKKVELHHHITDIILPGINSHWAIPTTPEDTKYSINHLANTTHGRCCFNLSFWYHLSNPLCFYVFFI